MDDDGWCRAEVFGYSVNRETTTKPSEFAYQFPKTGRNGGGDAVMVESIAIPHLQSVLASLLIHGNRLLQERATSFCDIQKIGIWLMLVSSHV